MTELQDSLLQRLGRRLAQKLDTPSPGFRPYVYANVEALERVLQPGDVLLVEGISRVSVAIKYLTQSTWSHSAFFAGDALGRTDAAGAPLCLIEANLSEGVVAVPLNKYNNFHTRICRPRGLADGDLSIVVDFMIKSLGKTYDMKNVFDLLRYFLPTPPVPVRWRRQMLALGAGDPTRAICSSLIAEAFGCVRYPILPSISREIRHDADVQYQRRELLQIRHHSLYAPRDFDISPYFEIVKPTLALGFDYRSLSWADHASAEQKDVKALVR